MITDKCYLYEQVSTDIKQSIQHGTYLTGDRLPSLRQLCSDYAVSLATAVQAYGYLQEQGVIESRPKRGYFVCQYREPAAEPKPSQPSLKPREVNVAQLAMSLVQESRQTGLVKLGAAVPGPDLLPLGALSRAMAGVARREYLAAGSYEQAEGNLNLRKQIVKLMREAGVRAHPDDVVITNGCLEALSLALRQLTNPGDTVAIESPTYFGLLQVMESLGLKVLELPTHPSEGMDLQALQQALNKRPIKACLLVPTYSNPLGACMPESKRKTLLEILAQYDVPLIEDDEYGFLSYASKRPKAIKAFEQDGNVIYCSSFSKTVAPGLRLGWMLAGRYSEQIRYQKFLDNISTAIHTQLAMAELLAKGSFRRSVRNAAHIYQHRMEQLRHWIREYFPANTRMSNPEGGFILWLELPKEVDSFALYHQAKNQRITITPGLLFSAQAQYTHHIRLSCGVVEGEKARRSIQKLATLINKMMPSI
ncbi:MAG: PLP-dependent aminotransferase family protein [Gammaproteobacteria bacterium]|nr:PLP-dependent aminotransferase family protein [Gammaproteobacteria bacterium]